MIHAVAIQNEVVIMSRTFSDPKMTPEHAERRIKNYINEENIDAYGEVDVHARIVLHGIKHPDERRFWAEKPNLYMYQDDMIETRELQ